VICLYGDDMIVTDDDNLMKSTIEGLDMLFKIKIQREIKDFVGYEII
jgi:hypothetical protein